MLSNIQEIKIHPNIRVFRDDVYPFLGGGNKGRKMDFIAQDIFDKKANALVTTGGVQSNHCRAVAVFAVQHGFECTLVLHGSRERFEKEGGNAKIIKDSNVDVIFVDEAKEIGTQMDLAMENYKNKGFNPYYIWGGGHTLKGGEAYIEAVKELKEYCNKSQWFPKYIFLASGTGSTQSGIMAGLDKYKLLDINVVGISIARKSEQANNIVSGFYDKICQEYKIESLDRKTTVSDEYLCGGYEQSNQELKELSEKSVSLYGFTLDTTYSGKAFYGMLNYLKENNIQEDILFWHTGGVLNYLAK